MTSSKKIIKYIAIALAIFLIFEILIGIISGSYIILNSLNIINQDENIIIDDYKTLINNLEQVSNLKIDFEYTNLYIKEGENFKIKTNNKKIKIISNDNSISIKEENKYILSSKNLESNLVIYIPKDITLDLLNIETGVGKINIEQLNTKKLYLELGLGEVLLKNVVATSNTFIDGGVSKTELINCNFNNLKIDLGVGEFNFNGILTGKNEIDSSVGLTNITLDNKKENYTIDLSKGLGNIVVDYEKFESDGIYGNGNNYLKVDGEIGEININFIK